MMRKVTLLAACVLSVAAISTADAQCNRGGGGTTSAVLPITTTGFNSPFAAFNSFNPSTNAALLAAQFRSQQYQNLLAQQQRRLQLMALRQQMLARQIQPQRNSDSASSNEPLASRSVDSVMERRRQQNAEKAIQLAARAEARGLASKAQSQYRRVIRIVGTDSELGSRARDAIAALGDDGDRGKTMLVANNIR